jgi:hypothetical protein
MYVLFVLHVFKLVVDEGETTRGEMESGRTGIGAKRLTGRTVFGPGFVFMMIKTHSLINHFVTSSDEIIHCFYNFN